MPVDRSKLNAVGDIVVTDAEALRALGDPVRLRLFELVQRLGPATAARFAAELGDDEETVEAQLAELEAAGLIEAAAGDPARWSTPARGIYFEIPEHGREAQQAARRLSNVMLARASELPQKWIDDAEPGLSVTWARSAGLFNARVDVAPDELRGLQDALERLLEPFTLRDARERPPDAATVRVLAFFLPEPPPAR